MMLLHDSRREAQFGDGELGRLTGSPVVELNRAIAVAETEGPEAGLCIIDQLGLDDFRYLHSTRAGWPSPAAKSGLSAGAAHVGDGHRALEGVDHGLKDRRAPGAVVDAGRGIVARAARVVQGLVAAR